MTASEPAVLSDEAQELLRRPNFAHLATIRADGTSSIAPVWIDPVDASTVIVSTGDGSHKVANLRRDPRVVISVVDFDNPYEELQLRGVAEIEPDPDMVVLDALTTSTPTSRSGCASRAASTCGSPSRRTATRSTPKSTPPPTAEAAGGRRPPACPSLVRSV